MTNLDPDRRTGLLTALRSLVGVVELASPCTATALARAPAANGRGSVVIRVLGARQLAQAIATQAQPTPTVLASGAVVDGIHAASMVGLAIGRRPWRRAALFEALLASSLGLASAFLLRLARGRPVK